MSMFQYRELQVVSSDDDLRQMIEDCRTELKRRTHSDDSFKAIKGQEHCKRALTVAAVQGHTVVVYGPHGCGKSMLVEAGRAIGVPVVEQLPCPCGNYTDPGLLCTCNPKAIRGHTRRRLAQGLRAAIHVECPRVTAKDLLSTRHGTTTSAVKDQLERIGALPPKHSLGVGCPEIIRHSMNELGLSAAVMDTCLSVAQSAAALEGFSEITLSALIEAIHYRTLDRLAS